MTGLAILLLVIYLIGGVIWALAAMASWDIARMSIRADSVRDRKAAARRMMMTPAWPLALAQWMTATIKKMAADAQEEVQDDHPSSR